MCLIYIHIYGKYLIIVSCIQLRNIENGAWRWRYLYTQDFLRVTMYFVSDFVQ